MAASTETRLRRYDELSLSAQTAYAELFESARAQELHRSIANLSGSFASKTVKGRLYWYYQYRDVNGTVRQLYVGPDTDEVKALIKRAKENPAKALEPLARSAIALGCERVLPRHFRVIRRLSEYGFFRAGGILIGTHAFLAIGNVLGIRWHDGSRTQDVDFAHAGKNISLALPATIQVDVHKALESLEMGFLPISTFGGKTGATYLNPKAPEFRIDFLTTLQRDGDQAFTPPNLNVALQPLKFMEFLLEHPVQAVVFSEEGAVVVNIPLPVRYALHKLVVSGEREEAFRTKSTKDLLQSAALIAYFKDHRDDELRATWHDLLSRGKGWHGRAKDGWSALAKAAPDLEIEKLLKI
ncbi:MAG TPA: nucleotidyltransferase domain-containing protein [Burkholderiales bacterium]